MITNKARLYTVFLALKEGEWIVLLTLHEVSSSSTASYVAVIWDLHVQSNMRSEVTGEKLIQYAKESSYECNWVRLEVGVPNVEKRSRTFSFYKRNGFKKLVHV